MSQNRIEKDSVAVFGRGWNALVLTIDGNLLLTTDIHTNNTKTSINLDFSKKEITAYSDVLRFKGSENNEEYSVTYGEHVEEVLEWIIQVLLTHSHPPNAPAIPDFNKKAQTYLNNLRNDWLINKKFKHN